MESDTALITCASCGRQIPANVWSCPYCGDLNPDAEAGEFLYLNSEFPSVEANFPTPMEPGTFATPMRPWSFENVDPGAEAAQLEGATSPARPVEPPVSAPAAHPPSSPLPFATPAAPAELASTPAHSAPARQPAPAPRQVRRQTHPPVQALQPEPEPELYFPSGTRQEVEDTPSARIPDEVLRLRPRESIYQWTPQQFDANRPTNQSRYFSGGRTRQPNMAMAPFLELLGYVGLLGMGHMYAGYVSRGAVILLGWWGWFLVARFLSGLSHGVLDSFLLLAGLLAPVISALWVNAGSRQNRQ